MAYHYMRSVILREVFGMILPIIVLNVFDYNITKFEVKPFSSKAGEGRSGCTFADRCQRVE